jgi:hypothetical protein
VVVRVGIVTHNQNRRHRHQGVHKNSEGLKRCRLSSSPVLNKVTGLIDSKLNNRLMEEVCSTSNVSNLENVLTKVMTGVTFTNGITVSDVIEDESVFGFECASSRDVK